MCDHIGLFKRCHCFSYSLPRRPLLCVDSHVEFGFTVVSNRVETRQFFIFNQGSKDGDFSLQYTGKLPIVISPTSGRVHQQSAVAIKASYFFYRKFSKSMYLVIISFFYHLNSGNSHLNSRNSNAKLLFFFLQSVLQSWRSLKVSSTLLPPIIPHFYRDKITRSKTRFSPNLEVRSWHFYT